MKQLTGILCLILFLGSQAYAQKLEKHNIYLFDMVQLKDSLYQFSNPKFLTAFNSQGYNNQPHFVNSDQLLITVQTPEDSTQTDIYALNLSDQTITRITATTTSEYSPQLMPQIGADVDYFSSIRQKSDEEIYEVWKYPIDRNNNGEVVFKNISNIGYYAWATKNKAAAFLLTTPFSLSVLDTKTAAGTFVTSNIGRCLQKTTSGKVAFVHKVRRTTWLLKELDVNTMRTETVTSTLTGAEDFVYLRDGTFLMGKGNKLFRYKKGTDLEWVEIADFSFYGIEEISRLAVGPGGLIALVAQ